MTLRTAEGLPPPASVLDPFFASGSWLGPKARVQGELTLTKVGAGDWGASFSGVLIDVDLARLVGDRVPDHRLDGLARVAVDSAEWGPRPGGPGSGWLAATGELDAGPGRISASLLDALRAEMHFRPAEALGRLAVPARPAPDLPYDRLGLRFAIEPDGEIQLAGDLGDAYEPGAVLTEPEELDPLILAPEGAAHMIGLRRTLGPVDSMLIPANFEQPFLDYLPLGAGVRPGPSGPTDTGSPGSLTIRVAVAESSTPRRPARRPWRRRLRHSHPARPKAKYVQAIRYEAGSGGDRRSVERAPLSDLPAVTGRRTTCSWPWTPRAGPWSASK